MNSLTTAVSKIKEAEELYSLESRIFLESTGIYHYPLFCYLRDKGFNCSVINPIITKNSTNINIRKVHNDRFDSKLQGELRMAFPQYLGIFSKVTTNTSLTLLETYTSPSALLISKVLQKARELSAQLFDTEPIQSHPPKERPSIVPPKTQIPLKLAMTAEVAVYPKLHKIYKELKRQNEIIFEAEKERNSLENKRDSLKGLARLTKKSEMVIQQIGYLYIRNIRKVLKSTTA